MPTPDASAAGTWTLGDRRVNRMGFGTMRLTAKPDRERAIAVVRRARELGVDHFDTAAFYRSPGGPVDGEPGPQRHAAEILAAALGDDTRDVVVTTKIGPAWDEHDRFYELTDPAAIRAEVEANLRLLRRDVLDVVNLRVVKRASREGSVAERFGVLAQLRDEGLIRHLGLSNVRLDHVDEAQAIAPVVCVQNSYALDQNRADDALLSACAQRGIAFVPFFAIAGARREAGASADHTDALREVAEAHGATPHQVRLAWTLHQGDNVLAIPGTGDVAHLEDNVAAGALRLRDDELEALSPRGR